MGVTGGRCNIHDRNGAIYGRGSHIVACVYARATWLTLMCDMTHPYGWDKTHLCVWYHLFIYLRGCDIHGRNGAVCGRGSYVVADGLPLDCGPGICHVMRKNETITHVSESWSHIWMRLSHMLVSHDHMYEWIVSRIWMSHVWHDSFIHVGCMKEAWHVYVVLDCGPGVYRSGKVCCRVLQRVVVCCSVL